MQIQIWATAISVVQMGNTLGTWGTLLEGLSEHVGKCMGNMVPTSKSKKIELWTPSLTPPKGK
jgi:hypothetical protein